MLNRNHMQGIDPSNSSATQAEMLAVCMWSSACRCTASASTTAVSLSSQQLAASRKRHCYLQLLVICSCCLHVRKPPETHPGVVPCSLHTQNESRHSPTAIAIQSTEVHPCGATGMFFWHTRVPASSCSTTRILAHEYRTSAFRVAFSNPTAGRHSQQPLLELPTPAPGQWAVTAQRSPIACLPLPHPPPQLLHYTHTAAAADHAAHLV
jgi:hypothetical protein